MRPVLESIDDVGQPRRQQQDADHDDDRVDVSSCTSFSGVSHLAILQRQVVRQLQVPEAAYRVVRVLIEVDVGVGDRIRRLLVGDVVDAGAQRGRRLDSGGRMRRENRDLFCTVYGYSLRASVSPSRVPIKNTLFKGARQIGAQPRSGEESGLGRST